MLIHLFGLCIALILLKLKTNFVQTHGPNTTYWEGESIRVVNDYRWVGSCNVEKRKAEIARLLEMRTRKRFTGEKFGNEF